MKVACSALIPASVADRRASRVDLSRRSGPTEWARPKRHERRRVVRLNRPVVGPGRRSTCPPPGTVKIGRLTATFERLSLHHKSGCGVAGSPDEAGAAAPGLEAHLGQNCSPVVVVVASYVAGPHGDLAPPAPDGDEVDCSRHRVPCCLGWRCRRCQNTVTLTLAFASRGTRSGRAARRRLAGLTLNVHSGCRGLSLPLVGSSARSRYVRTVSPITGSLPGRSHDAIGKPLSGRRSGA